MYAARECVFVIQIFGLFIFQVSVSTKLDFDEVLFKLSIAVVPRAKILLNSNISIR